MEILNNNFIEENNNQNILMSFVIPVFNQSNLTKTALKSLSNLPSNYEIIIVDNASTDNTPEIMFEYLSNQNIDKAKIVYIQNPENLYHSGGCNKGYKESKGKNICFLNNDIMLAGKDDIWPTYLIEWCEKGYLVGPTSGVLDLDGNFIKETDQLIGSKSIIEYLSGWCLAGSRSTFDKLKLNFFWNSINQKFEDGLSWGPWSDKYPMYFNDADLSCRARQQNIPLKIVKVPLIHLGKQTTKKLNNINELYMNGRKQFIKDYK